MRRRWWIVVCALDLAVAACSDAPADDTRLRSDKTGAPTKTVQGHVSGTGKSGLRIRSEPTSASAQIGNLDEGALVEISCRVEGESVNGNKFWDRVEDGSGGYVSDAYIDMGTAEQGLPRCDAPQKPAPTTPTPPDAIVDIEGPPVKPHVQVFANDACREKKACRASTYAGHQPSADLAIDFPSGEDYGKLPTDGHAFGDALAEFGVANRAKYRIEYVIYRQRINFGEGWEPMEDRGSITQNHFDHVHVSFEP
jgi:SH3 domain-containing protein